MDQSIDALSDVRLSHPPGHFYSPIVDPRDLARRATELWPAEPEVLGIDFNDRYHEQLLRDVFPRFLKDYDYPEHLEETADLEHFFTQNSQFSWLDSRSLFVLLRFWRPKRVIEVGSGFSTLLMADVNRRFLDRSMDITAIEPYPRPFLRRRLDGLSRVIEHRVEEIPMAIFEALQADDILFIDSSHVAKTGSDVNYLYFDVLPRLSPGVRIHIHDIFLPHDYLQEWVLVENRSWNEQYILRAMLMFSTAFRVLFGSSYASWRFPDLVSAAIGRADGMRYGGGSFWIERVSPKRD